MKRALTRFLICAILLITLHACEDNVEKRSVDQPDPVTPDLSIKVNGSVAGFVTDAEGSPVPFADVYAGQKRAITDAYGYFNMPNTSLPAMAGHVAVSRNGYVTMHKTFLPVQDAETFVRVTLLPKHEIGTIDASSGGSATTGNGAGITLPANGVVIADNGNAYSGLVHVNATFIDPAPGEDFPSTVPGDGRGVNAAGHLEAMKIFTSVAVELTADNGQALQIAAGKSATITLPIPPALLADAPDVVALWAFDANTGLWKQEGSATRTGNEYNGMVGHFSFWAGAEGFPLVTFSARVVDGASQPLSHVPVLVSFAGMPRNAGHGRFGFTDADGYITGSVFANASLVLDILTPCNLPAYSHEFSTAATDINLGTLTGNLGQNAVTLSGTVLDCEGLPVESGYVQTYDNGFYNRILIDNGAFTFTGVLCTNTGVSVVAVDLAAFEQSTPQTITINPGNNALGAFTACGTSTVGNITYTFDGGEPVVIQEPADTIAGYSLGDTGDWTQILVLSGDPNGAQQMAFQFDGGNVSGTGHKLTDVYSNIFPSGHGYWPAPVTVTITEYGNVGGFIAGSFSSNMLNFDDNALHTLEVGFRVRRYH